ncbi:hypothetical protein H0H81_000547 [Sphagnurus paluster]|uniref:Mitochondrial import inner membrane translocase subunit TIM50 n=1 Tax=Sphagnurus paluster TaxID=117069 RepID=A0A9P7KH15_9AGAR|nr:hypothetical protein H0H81_000547 [Sphagnurus paluster]
MSSSRPYTFTAPSGFDYNYDPCPSTDLYPDVYSNTPPAPPPPRRASPPPPPGAPAASGPSPGYLAACAAPSTPLPTPSASRKLLILDLNGTLVYRTPHTRRAFRPRRPRRPSSPTDDPYADPTAHRTLRTVHARAYMLSFRAYLFHEHTRSWLDTMVWSSAQPHSVADMVERAFGPFRGDLLAVWARDTLGLPEHEYHKKTQTTKDLRKPWTLLPEPHAHSAATTLLLDDSPLKAQLQPCNHLCIPEYSGSLRNADLTHAQRASRLLDGAPTGKKKRKRAKAQPTADTSAPDLLPAFQDDPSPPSPSTPPPTHIPLPASPPDPPSPTTPSPDFDSGDEPLPPFDLTLLAVIGVLEALKWEGNVAGWLRAGGLVRVVGAAGSDAASSSRSSATLKASTQGVDHPSTPLPTSPLSAIFSFSPSSNAPPPSSELHIPSDRPNPHPPPPSLDASPDTPLPSAPTPSLPLPTTTPFTPADPADPSSWFADPLIRAYWARAGLRALRALGLRVEHGIGVGG